MTRSNSGTDPGRAAVHDLGMLSVFFTAMTSFLRAAALVDAEGVMNKVALDHIAEAGTARGVDDRVPRGVADVLARAVERGHGRDGFSRIVDELRAGPTRATP